MKCVGPINHSSELCSSVCANDWPQLFSGMQIYEMILQC